MTLALLRYVLEDDSVLGLASKAFLDVLSDDAIMFSETFTLAIRAGSPAPFRGLDESEARVAYATCPDTP